MLTINDYGSADRGLDASTIPMLKLFLPVGVCHKDCGNLQTSFLHCSKATVGKSGLVQVVLSVGGEQCHQMDENKLGANSGRKTLVG